MRPLERLVGEERDFANDVFDIEPRVFPAQGDFSDLFSSDAADDLLTGRVLPAGTTVRIADARAATSPTWTTSIETAFTTPLVVASPEATVAAFSAGATIVFQGLHRQVPALADFAFGLSRDMWAEVGVNGYLSPRNAQGLQAHFDDHDVFVIQLHGDKHWELFSPDVQWPLTGAAQSQADMTSDPVQRVTLSPGDVMYLPRGWPHRAETGAQASLHMTIAVTTQLVADRVVDVVRLAVTAQPPLRRSLGLNHRPTPDEVRTLALDHLASIMSWVEQCDDQDLDRIVAAHPTNEPATSGRLHDLIHLDDVAGESLLRWRYDPAISWKRADTVIELVVRGATVELPLSLEAALVRLEAGETTRAQDLAETTNSEVLVLFAQQLVRHGVVGLVPDPMLEPTERSY